ncbi:hypothetical protein O181_087459 [Austropuccinia psidii MF-1]|uniref:Integrase catalytic domain-containing protein n=1 Tax=Austropuccinia psidii MF-1 TaxID=1389203 RepID=A0A9Q3P1N6_9BASI|nr:hypothetical protein [Austropuccinia psidii MF-1]
MASSSNPKVITAIQDKPTIESYDDGSSKMRVKMLNGENWMQWFEQLTFLFTYKGYDDLLNEEWVKRNKTLPEYKVKNVFAMSTLYNTVHEDLQPLFYDKKDFVEAIRTLSEACGQTSVILLCDSLFEMDTIYDPGTSLKAHVLRFQKKYTTFKCLVANTTKLVNITEGAAAGFLLRSLKHDDSLTSLVQNLYDIEPFNIQTVVKSSKNQKTKFQQKRKQQPNKQTLSGATPTRMNKEDEIDERFKQMESNIQLLLKLHNRDSMNQANEGSSLSSTNDGVDGESGFYVGEGINQLANNKSNQTFILDTGASTTTISNFELLIDRKPSKMLVKTFSGSASITHTGKLNLNGTIIQPVFYAPNGNTNLISLSQLEDQGIRVFHKNQKLILKSSERIVMEFPRKGKLYISCIKPSINHVEISSKKDWHILLGHPSDEYLKKFLKYNNMPSFDTEYATKCEICTQCKLKRAPHKNPIPAGWRPFEKIHFDLLEIKPYAKNSAQYVLVIIDDFSWFNRIMILSNKYQAETNLISFIREIKNKTGNYPLYLHSDQGGEFSSTKFMTECGKLGICFERGPADSPQSNGIAERFNQSLLIKICFLLAQCNLPINFWDEAANHASTIINLLPSRALNWKSPVSILKTHEMLIEPLRKIDSLIPFGIKVFVHQQNKPKPLPPCKPLLYLGYEKYSDAMRFFDPTSRKIVVSRDFPITQLTLEYGSKKVLKKDPITLPTSEISPLQYNPLDSIIIEPLFTSTTTALDRPNTGIAAPSPLRPPATVDPDKDHPHLPTRKNKKRLYLCSSLFYCCKEYQKQNKYN